MLNMCTSAVRCGQHGLVSWYLEDIDTAMDLADSRLIVLAQI